MLSPKYIYFLGLFVQLAICVFSAFLIARIIDSGKLEALWFVVPLAAVVFFRFIFIFLDRNIYIVVDKRDDVVKFGNIFFHQEVPLDQVRVIGKGFWSQSIKIQIGSKVFYFVSLYKNLKEVEMALTKNA